MLEAPKRAIKCKSFLLGDRVVANEQLVQMVCHSLYLYYRVPLMDRMVGSILYR